MRDRVIGGVGVPWGGFLLPRGVLLAVLLSAAAGGARAASESVAMPHEIDAWRARFVSAQRTYDGRRPYFVEDTAKLVVGRIDQRPVAALLFTLEGQHAHEDWQQYVAVFWSSAGNYLFCCVRRVGAKGTRLLDDIGRRRSDPLERQGLRGRRCAVLSEPRYRRALRARAPPSHRARRREPGQPTMKKAHRGGAIAAVSWACADSRVDLLTARRASPRPRTARARLT